MFLESFLQLLDLKCMAVEEKQLYLRGGSRPKIEPFLNMPEVGKDQNCGKGGNSRMRRENNKIVEEGIKKIEERENNKIVEEGIKKLMRGKY